ncbi:MAG: hypothetical protein JNL50_02470 [Phycisphaerae bacterium]|nr:hypothetical protein [Phycisphaerae bacterium]
MTDHASNPGPSDPALDVTELGLHDPASPDKPRGDEAVLEVLSEFQTGLESLKHLCSERKTQMEQLRRAEDELSRRATALAAADSVLSRARETFERENAALLASRAELDEHRASFARDHDARARELDARVRESEHRARDLEAKRLDLDVRAAQLATQEAALASLRTNFDAATRERSELVAKLNHAQQLASQSRQELEASRVQIANLQGALDRALAQASDAGAQNQNAAHDLVAARTSLAELQARFTELQEAAALDKQKLEQAADLIEHLRAGGGESSAELAKSRAHIETLSRELTDARAKLEQSQRDLSVLEQTEATSRQSAQQLADELKEARSFGGGITEVARTRKNRLQRAKLMLREQSEKLRVAGDALRARFEQCEQVLAQRQDLLSAREVINATQRRLEKTKARGRAAAVVMYACMTLLMLGGIAWIVSGQAWPGVFAAHSTIGADSRSRTLSQAELAEWQTFHQALLADPRFHEAAADRFNKRGIISLGTAPEVAKYLQSSASAEFNEPGEMKLIVRAEGADRAARLADTLTGALISYANASRQRRVDGAVTVLRQTPAADPGALDSTRLQMAGALMGGGSVFAAFAGVLVWRKLATAKSSFEQTAMLDAILDEQRWQPPTN